jgi:hypothetical protein
MQRLSVWSEAMTRCRLTARAFGTVLCFILACWPFSVFGQADPLRHGYAMIIGSWAYRDSRWPRIGDVQLQIRQLEAALKPHFDDVKLLTNPSFDQLNTGLQQFLRARGNNDDARLFIYYGGHGYTEINSSRNEYRGYITGVDTPYVDGTQGSFADARVKALSMEGIRGLVTDVNARQLLVILDSCFAGTVFSARSPSMPLGQLSESDIDRLIRQPVRQFITSGDMQERIPAHSPIPQLLVNALDGQADPYGLGIVTGQQIAQYFWSQTRGLGISPREGKLPGGYFDRGEFLFRTSTTNLHTSVIAPKATVYNYTLSFRDWEGLWDLQWEFEGQWYGKPMRLNADRQGIAGDYVLGTLKGSFDRANVLNATGIFTNTTNTGATCRSGKQEGEFLLMLSDDGKTINGWWNVCGEGKKYKWNAVKRNAP